MAGLGRKGKGKSRRYRKPVDVETEEEQSTTTPKTHFCKEHPITELHWWILGLFWVNSVTDAVFWSQQH